VRVGAAGRLGRAGATRRGPALGARIEAHAALILGLVDQKSDITLAEIQAALAKAGVQAGTGTIWRLFQRRRITRNKRRRTLRSRTARTS
jgi:transposase